MTESELTRRIIQYVKSQGGDAWKVRGGLTQRRGEPDIEGYIPYLAYTVHLKLEVKLPYNHPSPLQRYRLACYQEAGYCAGVVRDVEDLQDMLERYVHHTLKGTYLD